MGWGRLLFPFSDWPVPLSSGGGLSLWSAFSVDGTLTPSSSVRPPALPSPLVSRACGAKLLPGGVSGAFRFTLVDSSCVGLGLTSTTGLPWRGGFSLFGGSGCKRGFPLWSVLCDGFGFSVGKILACYCSRCFLLRPGTLFRFSVHQYVCL